MLDILSCHCTIETFLHRNKKGETALHRAVCYQDNEDIVEYLLALPSEDYESDSEESEEFEYNEEKYIFPRNSVSNEGKSAIHLACATNQQEYVRLMVKYKCDVNIQDAKGNTPLHYCAFHSAFECAKELLKSGECDLMLQNEKGRCALDTAAFVGKNIPLLMITLDKLKEMKQNYTLLKDYNGRTPLHAAVVKGNLQAVTNLVEYFSVDIIDNFGRNSLYIAIQYGHSSVLEFLVHRSNTLRENGNKLLLFAAKIREKKKLRRFWKAEHIIASCKATNLRKIDLSNQSYLDYLVKDYENIWKNQKKKKKVPRIRRRVKDPIRKFPS